jgi:cytochrome c-type biogenesis protein
VSALTPGLGAGLGTAFGASLGAAVGAGLLSFLSPCVLPLVPAWLSYLSGYGLADIREGRGRGRIMARTLAFTLGFTLVFVTLGLVFAGGAILAGGATSFLRVASGLAVILLGLNLIFDVAKFLNLERRFQLARPKEGLWAGLLGALLLGMAFAAGWSPCIGPILASILLLAAREGQLLGAAALLFAYSLGLALPFIAAGAAFDRMKPIMDWAKKKGGRIRLVAGIFLVLLGALMAAGRLGAISGLASRGGFALADAISASPGLVLALDLGLLGLLGLGLALPPLLRRAGKEPARALFAWPRILLLALVLGAGLGEALGLWSLSAVLASWLSFQGG